MLDSDTVPLENTVPLTVEHVEKEMLGEAVFDKDEQPEEVMVTETV